MYYSTTCQSPLGTLTLASDGESLVGVWMEGQKYFGGSIREAMAKGKGVRALDGAKDWLRRYFAGERPDPSKLSLSPVGSGFRRDVWGILLEIPYGEVMTYGDIARKMAAKYGQETMSAQAVGGAVGHNPISIVIPCHRVVGRDGSLTGYAGGIERKIKLLELEGADMSVLFIPKKGTAI
jgi:methylated-DNA-[protein]-cysteine S-methyltransferase